MSTYYFRENDGQDVNAIEIYRERNERVTVITADEVVAMRQRISDLAEALNDLLFATDGAFSENSREGQAWQSAMIKLGKTAGMVGVVG